MVAVQASFPDTHGQSMSPCGCVGPGRDLPAAHQERVTGDSQTWEDSVWPRGGSPSWAEELLVGRGEGRSSLMGEDPRHAKTRTARTVTLEAFSAVSSTWQVLLSTGRKPGPVISAPDKRRMREGYNTPTFHR